MLLAVTALGWLVLATPFPPSLLGSAKPGLAAAADGTWLLWVVATESISTAAAQVADHPEVPTGLAATAAVATWAIGVPYWIIMGATAITVVAGSRLLWLDPAQYP